MSNGLFSTKTELAEEPQWENNAEWESLLREAFGRDEDLSQSSESFRDWENRSRGSRGRLKASNWTNREIDLLYELFFPRFEDWRALDVQPSVRSLRKRGLLTFIETELRKANLSDPPKTTVQIDDKIKNDFKKIREKIVNEERGKPAHPLPPPLNLFEELVRNDSAKMGLLKVRYLGAQPGFDPVSSTGCILIDDDSREGSSESSRTKDSVFRSQRPNDEADDDIVDIEEVIAQKSREEPPMKRARATEPPLHQKSLSTTLSEMRSNMAAIQTNTPPSFTKIQRNLERIIESKASSSNQSERPAKEDVEKSIETQRLANERQRAQILEREKMLLSLQEEVLLAKLEASRAKRRYYEKKTRLACSSTNSNMI